MLCCNHSYISKNQLYWFPELHVLLRPSFTLWKLCAHVFWGSHNLLWTELHACGCPWALSHECISFSPKYWMWSSVAVTNSKLVHAKPKSVQAGRQHFYCMWPYCGHFQLLEDHWDAKPRRLSDFLFEWSQKPSQLW